MGKIYAIFNQKNEYYNDWNDSFIKKINQDILYFDLKCAESILKNLDDRDDMYCDGCKIVELTICPKQQIADLEAKLAESEKTEDGAFWFEMWQHKKRDYDSVYKAYIENCAEVDQLKQQLIQECKEHQEFCKVADEKVKGLEEENKRLSKNLRISWTKRMQFYNNLLKSKLKDVEDTLNKELFDGYYEKDISVGAVKVVISAVIDQQIKELKGEK